MPAEPDVKRAVAFVDGQNLFYAVKQAFGYTFPNYDIPALTSAVCVSRGWTLSGVRLPTQWLDHDRSGRPRKGHRRPSGPRRGALGPRSRIRCSYRFSQDQDLSEVADEVRQISIAQERWIKVACAFPTSPTYPNARGVNRTDWIRFDRALYDACIDRTDYRTHKGG